MAQDRFATAAAIPDVQINNPLAATSLIQQDGIPIGILGTVNVNAEIPGGSTSGATRLFAMFFPGEPGVGGAPGLIIPTAIPAGATELLLNPSSDTPVPTQGTNFQVTRQTLVVWPTIDGVAVVGQLQADSHWVTDAIDFVFNAPAEGETVTVASGGTIVVRATPMSARPSGLRAKIFPGFIDVGNCGAPIPDVVELGDDGGGSLVGDVDVGEVPAGAAVDKTLVIWPFLTGGVFGGAVNVLHFKAQSP